MSMYCFINVVWLCPVREKLKVEIFRVEYRKYSKTTGQANSNWDIKNLDISSRQFSFSHFFIALRIQRPF